jgi:hypothetical protein
MLHYGCFKFRQPQPGSHNLNTVFFVQKRR